MRGHVCPDIRRYLRKSCASGSDLWYVKGKRILNLRCSWMWYGVLCQ